MSVSQISPPVPIPPPLPPLCRLLLSPSLLIGMMNSLRDYADDKSLISLLRCCKSLRNDIRYVTLNHSVDIENIPAVILPCHPKMTILSIQLNPSMTEEKWKHIDTLTEKFITQHKQMRIEQNNVNTEEKTHIVPPLPPFRFVQKVLWFRPFYFPKGYPHPYREIPKISEFLMANSPIVKSMEVKGALRDPCAYGMWENFNMAIKQNSTITECNFDICALRSYIRLLSKNTAEKYLRIPIYSILRI